MKNRATKMEKGEQQIERVRRLSALHNEFERDQPVARAVGITLDLATLRELRGGLHRSSSVSVPRASLRLSSTAGCSRIRCRTRESRGSELPPRPKAPRRKRS